MANLVRVRVNQSWGLMPLSLQFSMSVAITAQLSPHGERSVAAIAVDLKDACKIREMRLGPFGLAVGGVNIGDHRRVVTAPRPIITSIGP